MKAVQPECPNCGENLLRKLERTASPHEFRATCSCGKGWRLSPERSVDYIDLGKYDKEKALAWLEKLKGSNDILE